MVRTGRSITLVLLVGLLIWPAVAGDVTSPAGALPKDLLFCIGTPDGHSTEFGLTLQRGWALSRELIRPIVFAVGRSKTVDWPHVQPGTLDTPTGKHTCRYAIDFHSEEDQQRPLFLILGLVSKGGGESPEVTVTVGGAGSPTPNSPAYAKTLQVPPGRWGKPVSIVFPFPPGLVRKGNNTIGIRVHQDQSIVHEPVYLPDGEIMFVSTRCHRWVNCWITQVATLHRCNADGGNIRALSSNIEHDNTPWVLPSGQILYTRWEYVDRSQLGFHHLWTMNPLGERQMVFFGNLHPGIVMIDAKPIPRSQKVVVSFSPGHGKAEHTGAVAVVDPRAGPDERSSVRLVSHRTDFRDPWAFSEEAFMAARGGQIVLMDGAGQDRVIYELPESDRQAGLLCHEPRPLCQRPRERMVPEDVDGAQSTGRLALIDVYHGRNMDGVRRGEIKKLLVLETLPKPINFSGGMEPLSYGGTFTLEISYFTITVRDLVADGRNGWSGSPVPRTFGSSASRLMKLVDGSHYEAKLSNRERRTLRLWIETGAAYPGTYAALGSGMVTGNRDISPDRCNLEHEPVVVKVSTDALQRRCGACHQEHTALPLSPSEEQRGMPFTPLPPDDVRRRLSRHLLYNLSRPEKSLILLAPLSKRSGGYESCGKPIFADTADEDYQKVLGAIAETKKKLDEIKRFDMPGFRPRLEYVREMKRFGILPQGVDPEKDKIDVYETDAGYWQSFHHTPVRSP